MNLPLISLDAEEPPVRFGEFLRTGYCCRCGDCCRGNPYTGSVEGHCPHYAVRSGLGECMDRQGAYYLAACKDWPSKPEHLLEHPKCTYRFERT